MSVRKALIIGCDGQDGHYLSVHLRTLGYDLDLIGNGYAEIAGQRQPAELTQPQDLKQVVEASRADEIYHLAAYHHSSETRPQHDADELRQSLAVNTLSVVSLLDAVAARSPSSRVFYASSSRVFGQPDASPQDESTPLSPVCPYGISKAAAMHILRYYRETHGLFACAGILYNHESPLRSTSFLSQKAATAAARAASGDPDARLVLRGSLDAVVDWSHAKDIARAMHAILTLDTPKDFIVASGEGRTVRDLVACAFKRVGLNWQDWTVAENPPSTQTTVPLIGNAGQLRTASGWAAEYSFEEMMNEMVGQVMNVYSKR
jgi:GDPmannose 4,6-dehydratase